MPERRHNDAAWARDVASPQCLAYIVRTKQHPSTRTTCCFCLSSSTTLFQQGTYNRQPIRNAYQLYTRILLPWKGISISPRHHGGRGTVKQVDYAENVGSLQNMKYRRVEKRQEGRGALYFSLSQVFRTPTNSTY